MTEPSSEEKSNRAFTVGVPSGWTRLSDTAIKQDKKSHPTTLKIAHQPHTDEWLLIEDRWRKTKYIDSFSSKGRAQRAMLSHTDDVLG